MHCILNIKGETFFRNRFQEQNIFLLEILKHVYKRYFSQKLKIQSQIGFNDIQITMIFKLFIFTFTSDFFHLLYNFNPFTMTIFNISEKKLL